LAQGGAARTPLPHRAGRLRHREPKWNPFVVGSCSRATLGCGIDNFHCAKTSAKGSIMSALISILITFLVVILVLYLVNMLPIEGRAKQIVRIIVIIIGVLSLLKYLGVGF
jgi:hypothetical protein